MKPEILRRYKQYRRDGNAAKYALEYARAATWCELRGYTFEMEPEQESPLDFYGYDWCRTCSHVAKCREQFRGEHFGCKHVGYHDHPVYVLVLKDRHKHVVASLGMVDGNGDAVYERSLQAEMMHERWREHRRLVEQEWAVDRMVRESFAL